MCETDHQQQGATASPCSVLHPVLYHRPWHPLKMRRVVRDEDRSGHDGTGGDHGIVIADGRTACFQLHA